MDAEAVVESFINGNLSWVKKQIRTKKQMAEVIEVLRQYPPEELEHFLRLMKS